MKKVFLASMLIMSICGIAYSSVFLECNPIPQSQNDPSNLVDHYIITIDGLSNIVLPIKDETACTAKFKYELTGISLGDHSIFIKTVNYFGVESDPFEFSCPVEKPDSPSGVKIVAE
ncbi:hypothetical protein M0R01_03800 [bacterium]|nr:hypothetical protein [bacterium]